NVDAGTYENRFYVRFSQVSNNALGTGTNIKNEGIKLAYTNNNNTLTINNNLTDNDLSSVQIFNIIGQQVAAFDVRSMDQQDISLQLPKVSSGAYIVKAVGEKGNVSKKIIVK
ncbi:MAG: T9SS type A sorting domain-containing protein, partial [Chitinophagaceae bacterium]